MGASVLRALRAVGSGGDGEAESEGWSGENGGSDATSDAETEEDEEGHTLLTTWPWGTQESGERGLRGDARSSGSGSRKVTSATADGGETQDRHGEWREQRGKNGRRRGWEEAEPWGVG